jgi:hypothetical protein
VIQSSKRGALLVFAVGRAPSNRPETLFRKTSQISDGVSTRADVQAHISTTPYHRHIREQQSHALPDNCTLNLVSHPAGTLPVHPSFKLCLHMCCLPQPIGRSVDETLRLVQAIQFHAKYGEVSREAI